LTVVVDVAAVKLSATTTRVGLFVAALLAASFVSLQLGQDANWNQVGSRGDPLGVVSQGFLPTSRTFFPSGGVTTDSTRLIKGTTQWS
jgi:hypothetical protein